MGFWRLLIVALALVWAEPVWAHHPFGEEIPATAIAGFLSGLGHPVIGLDHFAFVVAVGVLAQVGRRGWLLPLAFALASLLGASLNLGGVALPGVELFISLSVVGFGLVLAWPRPISTPSSSALSNVIALVVMGAIAGIFHGYAYGDAIVGAEPTPLLTYFAGFSLIQLAIMLVIAQVCRYFRPSPVAYRFVGFGLLGAGVAFFGGVF